MSALSRNTCLRQVYFVEVNKSISYFVSMVGRIMFLASKDTLILIPSICIYACYVIMLIYTCYVMLCYIKRGTKVSDGSMVTNQLILKQVCREGYPEMPNVIARVLKRERVR